MNTILRHIEEAAGYDIVEIVKSGDKHQDVVDNRYSLILVAKSYGVSTRLICKWLNCSASTINKAVCGHTRGILAKCVSVSVNDMQRIINGKLTEN
jgi:hypothetical protein